MADPWAWWDAATIGRLTRCPPENVAASWPLIVDALDAHGIYERDVARGVIGTVAIETARTFLPVEEAFWLPRSYREGLRYAPWWGRGYDQTTWESNYREAGQFLGRDLLSDPNLLLRPELSARVIAWRFATKGVPSKDRTKFWTFAELCRIHDWEWLRRGIQGATAGLDDLVEIVNALGGGETVPLPFYFDAPVDQQPDDWSCALQSVQWLLRSVGRNPDASDTRNDPWLRSQLVPGIISPDVGLRDGTGQQLAAWLTREYGQEMGFVAHAVPVEYDDVMLGAGINPTLIGGHGWGAGGHWAGVRGKDGDDLLLANPADGYTGIGQRMTRAEWTARGPWHAIYIDRLATLPAPDPPAPPAFDREAVVAALRSILARHEEYDAAMRRDLAALIALAEAA